MREYFNLPYENLIIISKEDMSRDITRKSGDKITQIKPNLQDKVSAKLAGMVDIVVRTVVEDDGQHTLQFKTSEVVFGGGRLKHIDQTTIPCDWSELMKVYADATGSGSPAIIAPTEPAEEPAKSTSDDPKDAPAEEPAQEEEKPKRGRRSRKSEPAEEVTKEDPAPADPAPADPEPAQDTPVRRQRKRRERA
jgi:hypothetical protein